MLVRRIPANALASLAQLGKEDSRVRFPAKHHNDTTILTIKIRGTFLASFYPHGEKILMEHNLVAILYGAFLSVRFSQLRFCTGAV